MSPEKTFKCRYCKHPCIKKGVRNHMQKWLCKHCNKYQQKRYAASKRIDQNKKISIYVKEGLGIRSMGRILNLSPSTIIARIISISDTINENVAIKVNQTYELDEMHTYIGSKSNPMWIAYAFNKETRLVDSFNIGRRSLEMLRSITDKIICKARIIFTDKLFLYRTLIPKTIHSTKLRGTNHIERHHLTLRTHLKRLNRKTICYSKSIIILSACLKIYFWG